MAADTDTDEDNRKSAELNDISLRFEAFNLDHDTSTTQTSLAAQVQHDLDDTPSGSSQTGQVMLEAGPPSGNPFFKLWPVVVFPPAYALHRYYRKHRPRRLPPFTPLTLHGLYGLAFASTMLTMYQVVMYTEMRFSDKRFVILDAAGDRAAAVPNHPKAEECFRSIPIRPNIAQALKRIHEDVYRPRGITERLVWWDRHIWSNQDTFNRWMLLLMYWLKEKQSIAALPPEDLEICATHLANRYSGLPDKVSSALGWGFGFSIPLAMFARWSGRRALYLPMNGLQRVLIGVYLYVGLSDTLRQMWYLRKIQKKDVAARLMVDVFGSFDREIAETGIDYSNRPSDGNDS